MTKAESIPENLGFRIDSESILLTFFNSNFNQTFLQHCVKFLVETCKLDPMKTDRWGFTPMSEAVRFKHESVVKYLNENLGKMTTTGEAAAAALS